MCTKTESKGSQMPKLLLNLLNISSLQDECDTTFHDAPYMDCANVTAIVWTACIQGYYAYSVRISTWFVGSGSHATIRWPCTYIYVNVQIGVNVISWDSILIRVETQSARSITAPTEQKHDIGFILLLVPPTVHRVLFSKGFHIVCYILGPVHGVLQNLLIIQQPN